MCRKNRLWTPRDSNEREGGRGDSLILFGAGACWGLGHPQRLSRPHSALDNRDEPMTARRHPSRNAAVALIDSTAAFCAGQEIRMQMQRERHECTVYIYLSRWVPPRALSAPNAERPTASRPRILGAQANDRKKSRCAASYGYPRQGQPGLNSAVAHPGISCAQAVSPNETDVKSQADAGEQGSLRAAAPRGA